MAECSCFQCLVLLAFLLTDIVSSIYINIDPQTFTAGTVPAVRIACTLNAMEQPAARVIAIQLARKGGRVMAIVQSDFTVTYNDADEDGVNADGQLENEKDRILKSYLNMTLKEPDTEDTGMYTCSVKFVTRTGTSLEDKASSYLRVIDPDAKSAGKEIKKALGTLDKERNRVRKLSGNLDKVMSSMIELERKTKSQKTEIADLVVKQGNNERNMKSFGSKVPKLNALYELVTKREKRVGEMRGAMKSLVDRVKKNGDELKEIGERETEDHWKVDSLVKKSQKETREMQYLLEKGENMEKRVNEMELQIKQSAKRMQEVSEETSVDLTEVKIARLEKFFAKGQEKDIEKLEGKQKIIEDKLTELEKKFDDYVKIFDSVIAEDDDDNGDGVDVDNNEDNDGYHYKDEWYSSYNASSYPMIAFAATNQDKKIVAKKRKAVVFPDVIFQETDKGGYNETTGEFTAPVDGIYHFSLVAKLDCESCHVQLDVKVLKKLIFRVKAGVMFDKHQGSASSVVQLKESDKVNVVVFSASDKASLSHDRYTVFSGHLVIPL